MKEELKDLAWAAIPPEARSEARREYAFHNRKDKYLVCDSLANIFGHHNLTSDKEPEEMVYVSKDKVLARYDECCSALQDGSLAPELRGYERGVNTVLRIFFPDTCLPPEPSVQKPTSAEPEQTKDAYEQYCDFKASKTKQTEETMEEKELNLAELLKDACGEEFYNIALGHITLESINYEPDDPMPLLWNGVDGDFYTYQDSSMHSSGLPTIWPTRESYLAHPLEAAKAWQIWAEERKPKYIAQAQIRLISSDGKIVVDYENVEIEVSDFDISEAAEAVKRTLMEFHEKNAEK